MEKKYFTTGLNEFITIRKKFFFGVASLLFLLLSINVRGQVAGYAFNQAAGSYTAITGTNAIAAGWDDNVTGAITIPFSFNFNGTNYTSCYVSSNGFITFGSAPTTTNYTPISSAAGYAGAISAFSRDLVANGSAIIYTTTGTSPNRTFVIQWTNARRYSGASRASDFNFQIRLNESSNVVQVVYGACASAYATDLTVQVGLRGTTNGDYNNRSVPTANWLTSVAGGSNAATCNTGNAANAVPSTGLTYTWTPKPVISSFTPTTLCASSSGTVTINGLNFAGATVKFFNNITASATVNGACTQITTSLPSGASTGVITVTTPGGSANTTTFTVTAPPAISVITGTNFVCVNGTTTLSDATPSGTWSSDTPSLATVDASGVVTGVAAGSATIRYTATVSGCTNDTTYNITVNPLPTVAAIGGPSSVCSNGTITLSDSTSGGTWSSDTPSLATVDAAGLVSGVSAGTAVIRYTYSNGTCSNSVTKNIAVRPLPSIGSQPVSQSICANGSSSFSFSVGTQIAGMAYQWYNGATSMSNGGNISGATSATVTFNPVTVADSGNYHCVVSGLCSPSATSNTVTLTVNDKIVITAQPTATQTLCTGATATFSVTVTGSSPTYQWYNGSTALSDGGTISGSLTNTLTISPIALTDASTDYHCVISGAGACLPITSSSAILIVNQAPVISSQPVTSQAVCDDDPVSLSILATGGSLTYQWYNGGVAVVNGGNISGATTDTLNFVPIHVSNAASNYYCVVTNSCTSITSTGAEVIVNLKPKIPTQSASTCSDIAFSVSPVNGVPTAATIVPGGTTYTWNTPTVTGGMTGGSAQTAQSSIFGTFNNPTNVPQTATYSVTPTSGTTGFCVGNPFTVTVTVNPVPDVLNVSPSICSGEVLTVSPTNGGGNIVPAGTTYSWGLPSMSGGLSGATTGSAASSFVQTLSNSTSIAQTATYTITATSGTCTGSTFTIFVTVNPKPTLGVSPATQTLCSGIAITPITFSNPNGIPGTITYNWLRDNTTNITGLPASGSGNISATLTNTTTVPQTTTFTIYAYSDQNCISVAGTASVTVSPNPAVNSIANQTICSTNNIVSVTPTSVAGATFGWTRTNTANISGIPDVVSGGTIISGSLTNLTNTPQLTTFTVTPSANGCTNPSGATTFSVTVNPSTSASATPATQTVCGGSAISITASDANNVSGTVFSFTKDSSVAGDAVSISGNVISGSLENNSGVDRVVTFTISATANGCPSSTTVTVTVKPNPAFTLTPATQNVCSGSAFTTINFPVVSGVTYTWTRTNPVASGNLSGLPDSATNATSISGTFNNLTTSNQTTTFTVTASINGCSKTQTVSITVYPAVTTPVISDTQTVCAGSRPTPLGMTTLPTGGSGTYTYQWQSASASAGPYTNISGATSASYWPPTTSAATPTTFYHLVVNNPCGSVTSNFVSVNVANNQNFTFSLTGGGATVCAGAAFNPQVASGQFLPDSYIRYSWAADVNYITPSTGGPIGTTNIIYFFGFPIAAVSTATLPLTTINNTGASVTTTVYITPNIYDASSNAFICSLSPQTVNVTILPKPTVTITAPSNGTLICSATSAGVTVTSNMTGTFTITRSTNANVTSSVTLPLTTASMAAGTPYTLTDNLTNTSATNQAVTYTITPSSGGCPGTAQTITINVGPQLLPGSIGTNHTVCFGGDPNPFTQVTAASGATSYTWEKSTTSATGPWTTIAGATGTTYDDPGPLTQTTWYRRVVSSTASGMPCSVAVTTPVQVTVNTLTAGSVGTDQTVCSGSGAITLTSITPGTGLATLSYQWQSNTTGCGGTFNDIAGATGITYTVPAGLATTTYFRRLTKSSAGTCNAASNCVTIYVNNVTGGTVGSDQVLCGTTNPDPFTESAVSTGAGTLSYQWQSTTNAAGCASTSWTNISFATSNIYDAPAGVTVTTYYRRVTTSTLNGVQCTANSNCITVTANSVTGGSIAPNSRTICSGGDPAAFNSTVAGTGTGLTYQWQSSPTGSAGTWTDISGATGLNYDPTGPMTTTTYYQRVAIATVGAATCQAVSNVVTVFVNNVSPPVIAGDQTVCSEDPNAFTVTTAATGTGVLSYQWQYSTTGCAGPWTNIGANSPTYDPPVLTLTTTYHVVVTSTLNSVACPATSNCVTVTSMAKTWNGSSSNDWNTANNWTPNGVPTSSNCVVIPNVGALSSAVISGSGYIGYAKNLTILNGGKLQVNTNTNIVVTDVVDVNGGGTFNILDSANLVQTNNVVDAGIVSIQRITQPMYRFDYTYWNSPLVMGSYTLGTLSQNLTQPDKYYSWNPSVANGNGNWIQESTATLMDPTKGYIIRAPNTFSFTPTFYQPYTGTFTGTPNNGDIQIPIKIGTLGAATTNDKLNLIGNPYASAVSALAFVNDATNVPLMEGTLYFWTHHAPPSTAYPNPFYGNFQINYSPAGYASLNALGSTSTVPSGYGGPSPIDNVASGQAFFIVGKATGTAYFRNSMRRTGNNGVFFRMANPYASAPTEFESHRIWLNMADTQGSFSQILIGYADGATNGPDRNYDGENFNAGGISFYSVNPGKKYVIQGRTLPFDVNDIVQLGYNSNVERSFTIGIDHLDGLFENQNVYLEDKLLNVIYDIKQNPYTFSTGIGTFDDRFVLRYTNGTLGIDNHDLQNGLTAFVKDKKLYVRAGDDIESIAVYDISGKLIRDYVPTLANHEFESEFVFAQGVYFAKVKLADGMISEVKLSNGN